MEYETIPKRYHALHDGQTGKSVIQEVGGTSFETDVDTTEWLKTHRPVSAPEPRVRAVKPERSATTTERTVRKQFDGT